MRQDVTTNHHDDGPGRSHAHTIEQWLIVKLAEELGVQPLSINVKANMHALGVDSAIAVGLAADLGEHVRMKLAATLLWDFPTVRGLAEHVAGLVAGSRERGD